MDDTKTTGPEAVLLGNAPKLDAQRAASLEARLFGASGNAKRESRIRQYVIRERIGAGAHGLVYRAFDTRLKRSVALKEVRVGSARTLNRLEREAQSLARLSHSNVVQVHECGLVGDARFFIAMEFVDGPNLDRWLTGQPRPRADVIAVFAQVADGLAALHREGLVHRDVKPANIIVGAGRVPKLVDLGLASSVHGEDEQVAEAPRDTLASTGAGGRDSCGDSTARARAGTVAAFPASQWSPSASVSSTWAEIDPDIEVARTFGFAGTPRFAAPEQFVGLAAEPRSDQFSFFVSLFAAVVGEHPFSGKTYAELARQVVGGEIAWPERGLPRRLRKMLERGLSVRAESRFESMEAVAAALRGLERRSPLRRLAPWGASAFIATGAMAMFAAPEPVDCDAIVDEFHTAWAQDKATLQSRAEADAGTRAASVAIDELDRWSQRWGDARVAACLAQADERPSASQTVACLDRGRDAFDAVVSTLEHELDVAAEPEATPMMTFGLWSADPLACETDPQAFPVQSEAVRRAASRLGRSRVLRQLGRWRDAQALAAQVGDEARDAGAVELATMADALQGELLLRLGENEAGESLLADTLLAAETHGQTLVVADVRAELARQAAKRGETAARTMVRAGLARLEAEGATGGHAEVELLAALAEVEWFLGDPEASLEATRRAYAAFSTLLGTDASRSAAVRLNLAGRLVEAGRLEEAEDHVDGGWQALERALGPRHPLVARHAQTTAGHLMSFERWDDAEVLLRLAVDVAGRHRGLADVRTKAFIELAFVHVRTGQAAMATEYLDRARPVPQDDLRMVHAKRWADVAQYAYSILEDWPAAVGAAQLALDLASEESARPAVISKAAVRLIVLTRHAGDDCVARSVFDRHAELIETHHPSYARRFADELPSHCKD